MKLVRYRLFWNILRNLYHFIGHRLVHLFSYWYPRNSYFLMAPKRKAAQQADKKVEQTSKKVKKEDETTKDTSQNNRRSGRAKQRPDDAKVDAPDAVQVGDTDLKTQKKPGNKSAAKKSKSVKKETKDDEAGK